MATVANIEWLSTAEQIRIPLRRVSGGHCTLWLGRLPGGKYQVAVCGQVPGLETVGKLAADELALPNRFNAILFGIRELKRRWHYIPALVADLEEAEASDDLFEPSPRREAP